MPSCAHGCAECHSVRRLPSSRSQVLLIHHCPPQTAPGEFFFAYVHNDLRISRYNPDRVQDGGVAILVLSGRVGSGRPPLGGSPGKILL
nr:MAG TPA: cytochrome c-551 [Bacteriophage sp.]DAT00166.1 MAG TPA: cytochrome c-551 [Caudoviricetes sp.]